MKNGEVTLDEMVKFVDMIGADVLRDCLLGRKSFSASDVYFDEDGRGFYRGSQVEITDLLHGLFMSKMKISNYQKRFYRLSRYFPVNRYLRVRDFQDETEVLLEEIRRDPSISSILNGPCLPLIVPRFSQNNFGGVCCKLVEMVEKEMKDLFIRKTILGRSVTEVLEDDMAYFPDGHQQLLMNKAQERAFVGLFFPMALAGFSVEACRGFVKDLPEGFALSGVDAFVALIMYPDFMACDEKVPNFNFTGISFGSGDLVFDFRVHKDAFSFCAKGCSNAPNGAFTSGLFYTSSAV